MNTFIFFVCATITSTSFLRAEPSAEAESSAEEVFTDIYKQGVWSWGVEWSSGSGGNLANAREYVGFIQSFLKDKNIQTVVDLGCGDWDLSRHIDWSGIHYFGFDVVKHLIERNQQRYGTQTISFFQGDGTNASLPKADLLICKDVLQHLPNSHIFQILQQLPKFKYCLITNDVNSDTLTCNNDDTTLGGYHGVDLTRAPFNISGTKILNYRSEFVTKQVLLICPKMIQE